MKHKKITTEDIYDTVLKMPFEQAEVNKIRQYETFYINYRFLKKYGINVLDKDLNRPILLLAGTSIPIPDRIGLIKYLLESGYEVATISNQTGGLFNVDIDPKRDRVDSLRDYLHYLMEVVRVNGVDILAQSYSAFEIIRVLVDNPSKYNAFVKSVTLINPPGFNENTGVVKHCSRFVFHHVMKGYTKAINILSRRKYEIHIKKFAKSEVTGINTWTYKTLKNPVRTMKEVFDIVSFKIKEPIRHLYSEHKYDINIFLQTGDQILPYNITLRHIDEMLPSSNVKLVPGGHNDVFIQSWQRNALLEFLMEIRSR